MFIEGLVTQIMVRAGVPILVNTADRIKSPTLSPGVLMWGVNICQIPHPQGQYFWSIIACVGSGGGGWGFQLTGALERSGRPVSSLHSHNCSQRTNFTKSSLVTMGSNEIS